VHECAVRLAVRRELARGSVLEAFDNGLSELAMLPVELVDTHTVLPEPLYPTIRVKGA
jgi:hypothetical protein